MSHLATQGTLVANFIKIYLDFDFILRTNLKAKHETVA